MTGVRPGKGCRVGSVGDQCGSRPVLTHKAPGSSHPHPRYLDFSGDRLVGPFSCFLYLLSSLGWAGLDHGLLPSLLASNLLAPPCPSTQFLGKATASANGDSEGARRALQCPWAQLLST